VEEGGVGGELRKTKRIELLFIPAQVKRLPLFACLFFNRSSARLQAVEVEVGDVEGVARGYATFVRGGPLQRELLEKMEAP
jgi:hypothetical protein